MAQQESSEQSTVDRALAALTTSRGAARVKHHLAEMAPPGAPPIEVDDLRRALLELRRRAP